MLVQRADAIYFRKYLLPLFVTTTSPAEILPLAMGLVVTCSPSAKVGEPLMNPVMDLSPFSRQRPIEGTPCGAPDEDFSVFESSSPKPNMPASENVERGLPCSTASNAFFVSRSFANWVNLMVGRGLDPSICFGGAFLLDSF
jgi:hypothetical protein